METLIYLTDDGLQALPFRLPSSENPAFQSIDTNYPLCPTDNFSTPRSTGLDSPLTGFRESSTEIQYFQQDGTVRGMSPQLFSETDGQQPAITRRKAIRVKNTPEVDQKTRRGRQSTTGGKSQVQQKGKGKPKTPRRVPAAEELRIRQQNKEASMRVRRRKGQEEADLWSRKTSLEEANRQLTSHYNQLKEEVYHIKEQLLQHSGCNCALMQQYIANEAEKSLRKLSSTDSSGLPNLSSLDVASPGGLGEIGSQNGSAELIMSPPIDLENPENADPPLFHPLCPCYLCRGETAGVSMEQAFSDVSLGDWEGSLDEDAMERIDGDEATLDRYLMALLYSE
ncbi:hypothetical protein CEP54_012897 [Fusarium duplospermum]|uniref:BZIP domain-containing protein n=1 Tax=Fusarium duplospermum TaxID=1325734 RepID=A0A428P613_9HYPO|nr:hypothetical protein CEP54_012897 [Fusarium duplospermum]